jgi:hypothetical protein
LTYTIFCSMTYASTLIIPLHCWYLSTEIHAFKAPKTVIFTQQASITPNLTQLLLSTLA